MLGLFCCDNVIISPDASRQRAQVDMHNQHDSRGTGARDSIINDVSAISKICIKPSLLASSSDRI